ncbi:hypothetical protein ACQKND_21345 [Viridibacillus arvi]|uniref:hypothetical protein n=1 Tax=Viridibacillus arvi TaxID=263475 RepID=UPI003D023A50
MKPSTLYFKWNIKRNFKKESMNYETQAAIKDGEAEWTQNLSIVLVCLFFAIILVSVKLGFEIKNDPFIELMQRYLKTEDIKGIIEVSLLVTAAVLGACISNLFNVITATKRQVSKILGL